MKKADFVDGSGILMFPSMKRADFVDEKSEQRADIARRAEVDA